MGIVQCHRASDATTTLAKDACRGACPADWFFFLTLWRERFARVRNSPDKLDAAGGTSRHKNKISAYVFWFVAFNQLMTTCFTFS